MTVESLPHLETFVEAAERGSFTAAARYLRISQAAVSQRVQQLEGILKASLFHREGGRISLTDAGRVLHDYSRRILALHREAKSKLRGTSPAVVGELILAASSIPGEYLLPPILAAFRQKHAKIQVRLSVADTASVVRDVKRGVAHLGVVGSKNDDPTLEYRPFGKEELVLVVPAAHPLRKRRFVPVDTLLRQPLIQRETGSASRQCFEDALRSVGHSASEIRVAMELGSNEAIKEAILQGVGIAILSASAVEKESNEGVFHPLKVKGLPLRREFFIVHDRKRAVPPSAQLFLLHATNANS